MGADLRIDSRGENFADLVALFAEADAVPALPFEAIAGVRVEQRGYRIDDIAGTLGSNSFLGRGFLVDAGNLAGTRFELRAGGPAIEELVSAFGDVGIQPGPFEIESTVAVASDNLRLQGLSLERPKASLDLDLGLGLPVSRRQLDFELTARGEDVRSLLHHVEGLKAYEQPFSVSATGRMRDSHWNFETVDGAIGSATFTAAGDLSLADSTANTEFRLTLSVPDLSTLGTVHGRRFNAQAFSLDAHAVGQEGTVAVDGMVLRIGQSDINGSVTYRAGVVPEVSVNVHSDKLVFLPLFEDMEEYDPEPEFDDGRFIPDIMVPFDAMKKVNGSVTADVAELQRKNLYLKDVGA